MARVSEILRFILPRSPSSKTAFSELRQHVATKGLVNTQYFAYILQNEGFPQPKPENQMYWYIGMQSCRPRFLNILSDLQSGQTSRYIEGARNSS